MNIEKINLIQLELSRFFGEMDKTSPSGDENCPWQEHLYQLERVRNCINFMVSSYDDIEHEYRNLMDILKELRFTVKTTQKKLDNPYFQIDFVSPQERHCHAYL